MTPLRRFGLVDLVLFLGVLALAGGVRAGYLMWAADSGRNAGPLVVQDAASDADLQQLINSVKDNNTFISTAPLADGPEKTAHASPGYPYLVGMTARIIAADRLDSAVRWGQCFLGALTAGLYYLFARRAFRSLAVGTLAGALCALHPFWVVNTAAINDGTLASFLVGLSLFVGARAGQTGGPFASLLYGLALAGAALVRAALLPFAFFALAWFLLRSRRMPSGWLGALLSFLGFVIGLAPWTIRNWQVFAEPTPIVDSAYLHVWMGNNSSANGGPVDIDKLTTEQLEEVKNIKTQPERYARLGRFAWDEMRRNPPAVPQHRLLSGLAFFFGQREIGPEHRVVDVAVPSQDAKPIGVDDVGILPPETPPMPKELADNFEGVFLWTVLGVTFFGLLGWRWSYGWRDESMPAVLAMIWIPLPYVLSHAEALSGPRLPLDGVLLCYTAFALLCFWPGPRRYLLDGSKAAIPPPAR
jgi:4-amino-4-deoxy-L-arabinose transferase-like glycosyltransferase